MQTYVILPDIHSFLQPTFSVIRMIGDLPVVSNNHKLFTNFHSGTLRIIDTMRLLFLFELLREHLLDFVLSSTMTS